MASLVALLRSIPTIVDLVQRFVEAWLSAQVRDIQDDHKKKAEARAVLIRKIEQARREKNREELIALNHGLAVLERGQL